MVANPNPQPVIGIALGHGAVVQSYTHGPRSRIGSKAFEVQTRMLGVGPKSAQGLAGGLPNLRRQFSVEPPKPAGAA